MPRSASQLGNCSRLEQVAWPHLSFVSLTLDELAAVLSLLECQDKLSPTLQTASSKIRAQAQALGFLQGTENFLLTPASTPVLGHFPYLSEGLGQNYAWRASFRTTVIGQRLGQVLPVRKPLGVFTFESCHVRFESKSSSRINRSVR
jgi:hypothetical protein